MVKNLRIWYWTVSAFVKKYLVGLLIGGLIGTLLAVYGDQILRLLPSHTTTHIAKVGSTNLNQLPIDIQSTLSRGLTKMNAAGEWELDAAENITVSDDGLTYTVKIKPDLKWTNNDPLTTDDIEIAIADVNIAKPDPYTIQFTLKEPFAPFPAILSQPLLKKVKVGTIAKKTHVIGLNKYSLQSLISVNQSIKSITLKSPGNTLIYHWYATEEDALLAYKLGHVDRIDNVSAPYLEGWANTKVNPNPDTNRFLVLFFNSSNPQLQDKTVRQLLAYATPKKTDETRVLSPVSKRSWAYNPQVKPYLYSPATAKSMLDKLKALNPNLALEFTVTTIPTYADLAQQIADAWQNIGIKTQIKIVSFPDTNDYEILLIGQQIPDDPDQYPLWHSTQNTNITHYKSPKIDKLLEDGRKAIKKEERKEIYQDFQRFIMEDSPAVFLHELPIYSLSRTLN